MMDKFLVTVVGILVFVAVIFTGLISLLFDIGQS